MDKFKQLFTKKEQKKETLLDNFKVSGTNRLKLALGSFLLGVFCFFLSVLTIAPTPLFSPKKFPVPYVLGNIMIIFSIFNVVDPKKCLASVTSKQRIVPFFVYLFSSLLVLIVAIKYQSFGGTIIILIIQTVSFGWLIVSYLPFGERIVKSLASSCL
ncbi:hypothetical protein M0813_13690 [Anaeramoeba flamelloides]|uniref:Vesicle transport protein n=1 Tax=Anaeramoeba flamelloides TaxID=1746091 RepID=A0ABQ8Z863_9EUKA|nr:hypothetical protein M0813_13690 [Anaeramoeba flamelloides]